MGAMIPTMTMEEALEHRHSVRRFAEKPIEEDKRFRLGGRVATINRQLGLHIQIVYDEGAAFTGLKAKYGSFAGVQNYIAMVGPKEGLAGDGLPVEEAIGYYGEELVLLAEQLGLSTCWVGGTFSKRKTRFECEEGEKLHLIIALGYAAAEGHSRKSKTMREVSNYGPESPDWFAKGVATALLAPTAINQQKFRFELLEDAGDAPREEEGQGVLKEERDALKEGRATVRATTGRGPFSKVDLGIARYHFALGAGTENFRWEDKAAPAVPPPRNAVFRDAEEKISPEAAAREAQLNEGGAPSVGFCSGCGGCWGEDSGRKCTMLRR